MIILQFQGPFIGPIEPSQNRYFAEAAIGLSGGPGQGPSGPTVIRPLYRPIRFTRRLFNRKNFAINDKPRDHLALMVEF